jgi:hypothetical protein
MLLRQGRISGAKPRDKMASLVSSSVAVSVVDRTAIAYKRLVYFWLVCFGCHRAFAYSLALAQRTEAIAATHY